MTRKLEAARRAPKSGALKSAVVFLHGYGADGADLLGLADALAPHRARYDVCRTPDRARAMRGQTRSGGNGFRYRI